MAHKNSTKIIDEKVGRLDKSEDGSFILTIETKDDFEEHDVSDLLEKWVGGEMAFKYTMETTVGE